MPKQAALLTASVTMACLAASPVRAEGAPDWPCVQPLVATLTASSYWGAAPPPPGADWHHDPRIAALVTAITPRDVPLDDARNQLSAFADSVPPAERAAELAETFQGLVDATNEERGRLIARIEELGRRQRGISASVVQLQAQLADATPGTPAYDSLVQRRDFSTRVFQETQRTMRYACEAPTTLDARLGQFARTLQDKLPD